MALKTFHNLKDEQREKIIKAAFEEFAFYPYQTASLSNIIKKVGVAKGSFYRYFENKISLYSHLLDHAYEMRMEQLSELLDTPTYDFFDILRENFRNKVLFDLAHPLESIFLYNAYLDNSSEEIQPLIQDLKLRVVEKTTGIIRQFQDSGKLTRSVSPEFAAHFIFQALLGIYDYLALAKGINFSESIKNGHLFAIPEAEVMEAVDELLRIIESGLKV
jgi:AcrR family transcriptional regulator